MVGGRPSAWPSSCARWLTAYLQGARGGGGARQGAQSAGHTLLHAPAVAEL
jgi:hypothetical protein